REAGDAVGDCAAVARLGDALVEGGEDAGVVRHERAEAHREHDADNQRQGAALPAGHAAQPVGGLGRGAGTGECRGSERVLPDTSATAARAQRIRPAAVSGCSPYACATRAAQPLTPNARTAAAIAWRTCSVLGSSERRSVEKNSASARAATMLRR